MYHHVSIQNKLVGEDMMWLDWQQESHSVRRTWHLSRLSDNLLMQVHLKKWPLKYLSVSVCMSSEICGVCSVCSRK